MGGRRGVVRSWWRNPVAAGSGTCTPLPSSSSSSPLLHGGGGININYVSKGRLRLRTGCTSSRAVPFRVLRLWEFAGMSSRLAFLLIVGTAGACWLLLPGSCAPFLGLVDSPSGIRLAYFSCSSTSFPSLSLITREFFLRGRRA